MRLGSVLDTLLSPERTTWAGFLFSLKFFGVGVGGCFFCQAGPVGHTGHCLLVVLVFWWWFRVGRWLRIAQWMRASLFSVVKLSRADGGCLGTGSR